MPIIKDTHRRMLIFACVGVLNTAVDFATYAALTEWLTLTPVAANIIAFMVASLNSYALNGRFTFNGLGGSLFSPRQGLRFMATAAACLAISTATLTLCLHVAPNLVAKLIAAIVTFFFGFAVNRLWVFRAA